MKNPYGAVVFLTGASSGIGKATAHLLAQNGFKVYGGSRRGGDDIMYPCGGFVKMCRVDVCDYESVKCAVKNVFDEQGDIDILINAAGNGICGAVDESDVADAMYQFNTNYFGVIRTIGAICPHMRANKRGLIINVGSVGGLVSIPFQTLYSSSKYALEALTEGLRIEVAPFNVKATLIEPGDIKTEFTASRVYSNAAKNSSYGNEFKRSIAQMEKDETNGKSPDVVANAILRVIQRKHPPVRTVVGGMYKFFVFLKRVLPACAVESLLRAMYPNKKT